MSNEVTVFFKRQSELIAHLLNTKEVSLAQDAEQMLQKNLPLAAASYFEHHVCEVLRNFVTARSGNCIELCSLVEQTTIKRQYHAMFDWEGKNVNKFLSLFGQDFKKNVSAEIAANAGLTKSSRDFLEIGYMRNCIVHQNYATYLIEKSASEIYSSFESGRRFVDFLTERLK